jgi:hypothetical protein
MPSSRLSYLLIICFPQIVVGFGKPRRNKISFHLLGDEYILHKYTIYRENGHRELRQGYNAIPLVCHMEINSDSDFFPRLICWSIQLNNQTTKIKKRVKL